MQNDQSENELNKNIDATSQGVLDSEENVSADGIITNSDIYDALMSISQNINQEQSVSFVQEYGPIITACVILASGVIAIIGIRINNSIAKRRATIDFIEAYESGAVYRDANRRFRELRLSSVGDFVGNPTPAKTGTMRELAGTTDQGLLQDREHINNFLNHHELLAIGMNRRALDEKFYRTWMEGPVIRDWTAAQPYIQRERWKLNEEGNDFIYRADIWCKFEALAIKWSRKKIKILTDKDGQKPDLPSSGDEVPFGDQNNDLSDDSGASCE